MPKTTAHGEKISDRAAGRATLARQHLLSPVDTDPVCLTENLAGLQAQTPWTWYGGFHSRMEDADPDLISRYVEERRLVRISTMRSTIHLLTPEDAAGLRELTQPAQDKALRGNFGTQLRGVDIEAVTEHAAALFEEQGPMTFSQVGELLSRSWPDAEPHALSMVARHKLPLVQVPPRGLWKKSGPIAHTTLAQWGGGALTHSMTLHEMVLRYLAAFGPASVADFQTWSGLTRMTSVFRDLEPQLVPYVAMGGQQLYDLPAAPRPAEDVPAPVQLLYDYDNLLLSHKDRSRFITTRYIQRAKKMNGVTPRAVLIDGMTAGTWTSNQDENGLLMLIQLFDHPSQSTHESLLSQGQRLGQWMEPEQDCQVAVTVSDQ